MAWVDRIDGRVRVAVTSGMLVDDGIDGELLTILYMSPSDAIAIAESMRVAGEEILGERAEVSHAAG